MGDRRADLTPYAEKLPTEEVIRSTNDLQDLIRKLRQDLEEPMADAGHTDKLLGWSLPESTTRS